MFKKHDFHLTKMIQYFPKPFRSFGRNINVKVDLSNYATKGDIKHISHVDISSFALKINLANLKTEVDKLDTDKLVPIRTDLSKLGNLVKNDVVKKDVYDKLVSKVNATDTSRFVLKTKYNTDKSELENKIRDARGFVKRSDYNTKITEIEVKIPDISNLATKTALTTVENKIADINNLATKTALNNLENKIPDVNSLVKKTNHNTEVAEIDTKLSSLDGKITKNKNDLTKIGNNIALFFGGNIMFNSEDGSQAYSIFQPLYRHFKTVTNANYISSWKYIGLSAESIRPTTTSDNSLTPELSYVDYRIRETFTGSCLKQPKIAHTHKKVVNIYNVYELGASTSRIDDPTLKNCLFGAVSLTKNADIDKYGYSGYGIGLDRRGSFSFPGGGYGQNVLIFGTDMSSFPHIDNKKRHISIRNRSNTKVRTYINCRKNVCY